MRKLMALFRTESGLIGSGGVTAATVGTAALGGAIVTNALPATGIAIGLYVLVGVALVLGGLVMRWSAARHDRKGR